MSFKSKPVGEFLPDLVAAGVKQIGIPYSQLAESGDMVATVHAVRQSELSVCEVNVIGPFSLPQPQKWDAESEKLLRAAEIARDLNAGIFYVSTGCAAPLSWEEAATALSEALSDVLPAIAATGVEFAVENTPSVRPDIGFVTDLDDCAFLATQTGTRICFDVAPCWQQRGLAQAIADSVDNIGLVQLSDAVLGSISSPDRAVPGDGVAPLEKILVELKDGGYGGPIELEVMGPRIDREGALPAVLRGARYLEQLMDKVGYQA